MTSALTLTSWSQPWPSPCREPWRSRGRTNPREHERPAEGESSSSEGYRTVYGKSGMNLLILSPACCFSSYQRTTRPSWQFLTVRPEIVWAVAFFILFLVSFLARRPAGWSSELFGLQSMTEVQIVCLLEFVLRCFWNLIEHAVSLCFLYSRLPRCLFECTSGDIDAHQHVPEICDGCKVVASQGGISMNGVAALDSEKKKILGPCFDSQY